MRKLLAQFKFSPGTAPKWVMVFGMVYFSVMFVESMFIPCMQVDEAAFALQAVRIFNNAKGLLCDFSGWRKYICDLPMFYTSYTGFFKSYSAAPFVWFFGPRSICVIRMQYLFWGLGGLYSMYYVLRRSFGLWPAAIAVVLLATDTFFIRCMVSAVLRDEMLMNAMFWMALVCLCRVFDDGRFKFVWLSACGLIIGLGLWAKFIFAGYILGGMFCLVVIDRQNRQAVLSLLFSSWTRALLFISFVTAGFYPMIHYNIYNKFPSFAVVSKLFTPVIVERQNWDNSNFVINFMTRLWNLFHLFLSDLDVAGIYVYSVLPVVPDIVQFCVIFFAFFWLLRGLKSGNGRFFNTFGSRETVKAMLAISVVLFLGTCFVPGQYSPNHVVILLPFVKILMSLFLVAFCAGNLVFLRRVFVSLLLCLSIAVQVFNIAYFKHAIANGHVISEYFYPHQMEIVRAIEGHPAEYLVDATDTWQNVWRFFTNERVCVAWYVGFHWKYLEIDEDLCIDLFCNRFVRYRKRSLYLAQLVHSDSLETGRFIEKFPELVSMYGSEMNCIKKFKSPNSEVEMFRLCEVLAPED